jgi:hypothetical protein
MEGNTLAMNRFPKMSKSLSQKPISTVSFLILFIFILGSLACTGARQEFAPSTQNSDDSQKLSFKEIGNRFPDQIGDFELGDKKIVQCKEGGLFKVLCSFKEAFRLRYNFKEMNVALYLFDAPIDFFNEKLSGRRGEEINALPPEREVLSTVKGSSIDGVNHPLFKQLWIREMENFVNSGYGIIMTDAPYRHLDHTGLIPSERLRVAFYSETGGWVNHYCYTLALGEFDGIIAKVKMKFFCNTTKQDPKLRDTIFGFLEEVATIVSAKRKE